MVIQPYDETKYIKVVCRLCGTEWLYPKQYEKEFDAEHPLENCAYCKRNNPIFERRYLGKWKRKGETK